MIRFTHALLLILCAFAAVRAEAGAPAHFTGKGVSVQLVSDARVIQPGQTFHLGLQLHHEPGYHTYWQNPGLAGVPTRLVPALPPGFSAGALIYPPPDKVKMAAIRVHGYEHDVLIALPITAPATLPPGPLTFDVKATWMACLRTCNPGLADLSLTLQTGSLAKPDPAWAPQFQALRESQPPPLTGWTLTARRTGSQIEFFALPPKGFPLPEQPQFFSLDNLICSHPVQDWQKDGPGYRVRLTLSDYLPENQTELKGLLFGQGPWMAQNPSHYAAMAVPVQP